MEKNQAVPAINFIDFICEITQLKDVNHSLNYVINEGINKIINKTKNRLPANIKLIWNKINSNNAHTINTEYSKNNLTRDELCCLGKWFVDNIIDYKADKTTIKSIDYFQQRHPSIMAFICFFSAGEIFKSGEAWENLAKLCFSCEKKHFFILTKDYSKNGLDYYTGALGQDKTHIQIYLAFHFYISAYNVYETEKNTADYQKKANNVLEECLLLFEEKKIEQSPGRKKILHKSLIGIIQPVIRAAINVNADIQEKKEELFTDILSYLLNNLSNNKNEVLKNKLFKQLSIHLLTICQNKSLNKAIETFEKLYDASSNDDLNLMLIEALTELLKNSQFKLDNAQEKLSNIFNLLTIIQTENQLGLTDCFLKLISIIQNRLKTSQAYYAFKQLYESNQDKMAKYMAFIALIDLIKQTKKTSFGNYFNKCITTIFKYADEIIASDKFTKEVEEDLKDLTKAINKKLAYNEAYLLNIKLIELTKYDSVKLIIYDGILNLINTHETHPYEFDYYESLLNKLFDILNKLSQTKEPIKESNFLTLITVISRKTNHPNNLYELIKRGKIYDNTQNIFIKLTLLETLILSLKQAKFDNKKPAEKNQKLAIHTASILQKLTAIEHSIDIERSNQLYLEAISIIETQAKALYPKELNQQFKFYVLVVANWLENKNINAIHSIKLIQHLAQLIPSLTLEEATAANVVQKIHFSFINRFDLNNLFKNKDNSFTEIIFKLYKNLFNSIETYCKRTLLTARKINEETKEKNEKIIGFIAVLANQTIDLACKQKALNLLINTYETYLTLAQKNKISLSTLEKEPLCANLAYYKLQALVVKISLDYDYSILNKRLSINAETISQFIRKLFIDNRDFNFLLIEKKNTQFFSFFLVKTDEQYKITAQADKNTIQINFKEGLLQLPISDLLDEWKNTLSIFIENLHGITLARMNYIDILKNTAISKNNTDEEQNELDKLKALSGLLNILLENPLNILNVPTYLSNQDFSNHPELKFRSSQRFSSLNLSSIATTEARITSSNIQKTENNSAENSDSESHSSSDSNPFEFTESTDHENDTFDSIVYSSDSTFSFESHSVSIEHDTKKAADTEKDAPNFINYSAESTSLSTNSQFDKTDIASVKSTDEDIKNKPEETAEILTKAQELSAASTYSVIATTLSFSEDKIISVQEIDSLKTTDIFTCGTVLPPPPPPPLSDQSQNNVSSAQTQIEQIPPPPPLPVVIPISNTLDETGMPKQPSNDVSSFSMSILSSKASLRKIDTNNSDEKKSSSTAEPKSLARIMSRAMSERRVNLEQDIKESDTNTNNDWSDDEEDQKQLNQFQPS